MSQVDTTQNDDSIDQNLSLGDVSNGPTTSEPVQQHILSTGDETERDGENVTAVVAKAKRAATFLWILLHAQVCKTCAGQCNYTGCDEAKRLLLHMKTCPAKGEVACPTGHNGCQQSRKLLHHYRKCREERARQRRQARFNQPNNFCLICTLLARHDKSISENSLAITSPLPPNSQRRNNQTNSLSSSFDKIYSPQVARRKARSKSVQFDLHRETKCMDSPSVMPPPPPRSRTASVGSISHLDDTSFSSVREMQSFLKKDGGRPRAESLDERKLPSPCFDHDPTFELELRMRSQTSNNISMDVGGRETRQLPFRKRSVSCSLIPNGKSTGCETIMEE